MLDATVGRGGPEADRKMLERHGKAVPEMGPEFNDLVGIPIGSAPSKRTDVSKSSLDTSGDPVSSSNSRATTAPQDPSSPIEAAEPSSNITAGMDRSI